MISANYNYSPDTHCGEDFAQATSGAVEINQIVKRRTLQDQFDPLKVNRVLGIKAAKDYLAKLPAPRASLPFFSLSGWLTVFFVAFVAMAAAASELSTVAQMMVNGGTR